jgi:formylmethanofuran dehydrogenase subunit E
MTVEELMERATAFHGEHCVGAALGVKAVLYVEGKWNIQGTDRRLRVWMGGNGCMTDAIQALTGATIGNKRMKIPGGRAYRFAIAENGIALTPVDVSALTPEEVLARDPAELFTIREEDNVGSAVRDAKEAAAQSSMPAELFDQLSERISNSLVEGKLPCAVAYRIADEMHVFVGQIGKVADAKGYKISRCQLGCFR